MILGEIWNKINSVIFKKKCIVVSNIFIYFIVHLNQAILVFLTLK